MAQYTIAYACGHGSTTKNLGGKIAERERYVQWAERNMACPECWKATKAAEDAAGDKTARICLVPAAEPVVSVEVAGQVEANKEALYALGYRWSDSADGGIMSALSMKAPARVLAIWSRVASPDGMREWCIARRTELEALGYRITELPSALDVEYLRELFGRRQEAADRLAAAKARLAEIRATDARPGQSPLRARIAKLEAASGRKWNGRIYGRAGGYSFYVADERHTATDAEVSERERMLQAAAAWDAKYKAEIEAAKG